MLLLHDMLLDPDLPLLRHLLRVLLLLHLLDLLLLNLLLIALLLLLLLLTELPIHGAHSTQHSQGQTHPALRGQTTGTAVKGAKIDKR